MKIVISIKQEIPSTEKYPSYKDVYEQYVEVDETPIVFSSTSTNGTQTGLVSKVRTPKSIENIIRDVIKAVNNFE